MVKAFPRAFGRVVLLGSRNIQVGGGGMQNNRSPPHTWYLVHGVYSL